MDLPVSTSLLSLSSPNFAASISSSQPSRSSASNLLLLAPSQGPATTPLHLHLHGRWGAPAPPSARLVRRLRSSSPPSPALSRHEACYPQRRWLRWPWRAPLACEEGLSGQSRCGLSRSGEGGGRCWRERERLRGRGREVLTGESIATWHPYQQNQPPKQLNGQIWTVLIGGWSKIISGFMVWWPK